METIRQRMIALLIDKEMDARELSRTMGIREKEIYEHLPHIALSVARQSKRLIIHPVRCLACGYLFKDRKRFTLSWMVAACEGETRDVSKTSPDIL
jgi:predicted Zn-ribbon and HTH transcriptional regulator